MLQVQEIKYLPNLEEHKYDIPTPADSESRIFPHDLFMEMLEFTLTISQKYDLGATDGLNIEVTYDLSRKFMKKDKILHTNICLVNMKDCVFNLLKPMLNKYFHDYGGLILTSKSLYALKQYIHNFESAMLCQHGLNIKQWVAMYYGYMLSNLPNLTIDVKYG
jgi:hypothetical protein